MGRLIDADALLEAFTKATPYGCGTVGIKFVDDLIKEQPTAYDVEKVVEAEEKFLVNFGVPKSTPVHRKIIGIIRNGGKE